MKKGSLFVIILLLIFSILFFANEELNKKKPYNFYYTNLLAKNLTLEEIASVKALDVNYYKTKDVTLDDISTIKDFMKYISQNDFSSKPIDLPVAPVYKIFFTLKDSNEMFVVNVYSSKYLSVYPWDGDFEVDYIDMSNIPVRYNIYNLCKYIF
ncbi:DUF4883 family protein [Clostridium grantii]|uniref:Uncharacterized protein n=1 Tax=Clostridium grantii DSM 8605 TaxID=1121316 RepID=A0A1M5UKK6_9CLOT|nr:DUF4883 family protein [Clostridium grantii]SHH63408.1 DOmain of unknown function [Clostridium grantii DSM 8605]